MSSSYGELLKDMEIGLEEGEKPVSEFLKEKFGIITKNVGSDRLGWDLQIIGIDEEIVNKKNSSIKIDNYEKKFVNKFGRTFEIKRDKASDRTGNFFYEVWSSHKVNNPGSMNKSKADTLVIVRSKEFVFVDRGILLSWIMDNLYSNSELGNFWRKKTSRKVKLPQMKTCRHNKDVSGILIPIENIKEEISIACFER